MGYLQAQMRLGTRQYGKGFHCYSGHFQGFLQGSCALIRTREDMGVNINHSKAQSAWRPSEMVSEFHGVNMAQSVILGSFES
jgi:hypothetical protein